MERLLAKLSPKPQSTTPKYPVDQDFIAALPDKQDMLRTSNHTFPNHRIISGDESGLIKTSSIQRFRDVSHSVDVGKADNVSVDMCEVLRLKQELLVANSKIALQEQELAQTRVIKHTLDQALGPPS